MKYTIIFGSPRRGGNTIKLLDVVIENLQRDALSAEADIQIDRFDVYDSNVGGCRACLGCQNNADEICCIIDDDMQPILKSVAECDTLIIAAPVYIWSLPAPVKAVVDRLVYSSCKQYGDNPGGPKLLEGKHLALITTCGYPVEKGADLLEEELRRFCKHTGMHYIGMICERQRNLKDEFMDEAKSARASEFADTIKELTRGPS